MNGYTGTRNRQQDAACPASQFQDWAANPLCQLQIERHIHQVLFSGISLVVVFGRYAVGLNAIGHLGLLRESYRSARYFATEWGCESVRVGSDLANPIQSQASVMQGAHED